MEVLCYRKNTHKLVHGFFFTLLIASYRSGLPNLGWLLGQLMDHGSVTSENGCRFRKQRFCTNHIQSQTAFDPRRTRHRMEWKRTFSDGARCGPRLDNSAIDSILGWNDAWHAEDIAYWALVLSPWLGYIIKLCTLCRRKWWAFPSCFRVTESYRGHR